VLNEGRMDKSFGYQKLKEYLISILERVYKYHIAYKTMLYDLEDKGMFAPSNGGYIYMKKLYSTIGILGYCEAAQFLGMKVSNNKEYIEFLQLICGTIKEQNKLHSIHDKKRPFLFNSEAIPGESLGVKLYEHDKKDGYWVPENQNLYNCYFYNPWDNTSILDKFILHGKQVAPYCDGGQALHANLDEHLSKEQYLKLIDFAIKEGTNYFTFNIPISECKSCGHVVNAPIDKCPKCGSENIDYWTRIIGYLRPVSAFSNSRKIEQKKRIYAKNDERV
jgi:ribonucleoside-triphosphate reductase